MSRRIRGLLAPILAATLALACAGWWLSKGAGDDPRPVAPADPRTPAQPAASEESVTRAAGPTTQSAPVGGQQRRAADQQGLLDQADVLWVEGVVVLPPGTPANERVRVVARGRELAGSRSQRADVEADGRFRVAFAPKTRSGWLLLEAPHVYIEPLKVEPAKVQGGVRLEAQLGGRVVGRVVLPEGARGAKAGLDVAFARLQAAGPGSFQRLAPLDENLRFELGGVPPGIPAMLECAPEGWLAAMALDVTVEALQTREVELELRRGVTLAGHVVDSLGGAVSAARVHVFARGPPLHHEGHETHGVQEDGSFELRGLDTDVGMLCAHLDGRPNARLPLDSVEDGSEQRDLELRFHVGRTLRGRVLWGHGDQPAAGVRVLASEVVPVQSSQPLWDQPRTTTTAADGSFEIAGLGEQAVAVEAQAEARPAAAGGEARAQRWIATAQGIAPDARALTLRLHPGLVIEGRVVDDSGIPLRRFWVSASIPLAEQPWTGRDHGRSVTSAEGRFRIDGLVEGLWKLEVDAEGHVSLSETFVPLPGDGKELEIVLARTVGLAGVVLAPDGRPCAGASIGIKAPSEWHGGGQILSGEDGLFVVEDLVPGRLLVRAHKDGVAESPPLVLDALPGERLDGLVLQLRCGSNLSGELSAEVLPREGRRILLMDLGASTQQQTGSDASGRFVFKGLPAGEYRVVLPADETGVLSSRAAVHVQIEEGRDAHVVLGGGPAEPIEVTGRVRGRAGPVADVMVVVSREREQLFASTRSDANGSYALVVDGPGLYQFHVHRDSIASIRRETIPVRPRFQLDLVLEGSSLRGHVLDPAGQPRSHASVTLDLEATDAETRSSSVRGRTRAGTDGSFAFDGLDAGTYVLTASPVGADARAFAEVRRGGLRLDGQSTLEGLELRLSKAGMLEGCVRRADGSAAAGARVFAREADGTVRGESSVSDATGRYRFEGLASGAWSVFATDGLALVSEESAAVRVEGNRVQQDLRLAPGTRLLVLVEDAAGKQVGASISALDRLGRECALGLPTHVPAPSTTTSPGRTVGPLAPGTYRVTARNHGGAKGSALVRVHGEADLTITLRLSGP